MDGTKLNPAQRAEVDARLLDIKKHMPTTYEAVQAKALELGREAFALVRRGVAGQPNTFYAVERGWVMGTPFSGSADITRDVAQLMVQFGCRHLVMWGRASVVEAATQGAAHGAN